MHGGNAARLRRDVNSPFGSFALLSVRSQRPRSPRAARPVSRPQSAASEIALLRPRSAGILGNGSDPPRPFPDPEYGDDLQRYPEPTRELAEVAGWAQHASRREPTVTGAGAIEQLQLKLSAKLLVHAFHSKASSYFVPTPLQDGPDEPPSVGMTTQSGHGHAAAAAAVEDGMSPSRPHLTRMRLGPRPASASSLLSGSARLLSGPLPYQFAPSQMVGPRSGSAGGLPFTPLEPEESRRAHVDEDAKHAVPFGSYLEREPEGERWLPPPAPPKSRQTVRLLRRRQLLAEERARTIKAEVRPPSLCPYLFGRVTSSPHSIHQFTPPHARITHAWGMAHMATHSRPQLSVRPLRPPKPAPKPLSLSSPPLWLSMTPV